MKCIAHIFLEWQENATFYFMPNVYTIWSEYFSIRYDFGTIKTINAKLDNDLFSKAMYIWLYKNSKRSQRHLYSN